MARTFTYLVYRHGMNAANQRGTQKMAVAIVDAPNQAEACRKAEEGVSCYFNQHLTAVPQSRASSADWNAFVEEWPMRAEMRALGTE